MQLDEFDGQVGFVDPARIKSVGCVKQPIGFFGRKKRSVYEVTDKYDDSTFVVPVTDHNTKTFRDWSSGRDFAHIMNK